MTILPNVVFNLAVAASIAWIAFGHAQEPPPPKAPALVIRLEGGLYLENFGGVVIALARKGLLDHRLFVDQSGVTPEEMLKATNSLAGHKVSLPFELYLCEINPHVCNLSRSGEKIQWRNQKAPQTGKESKDDVCGPSLRTPLDVWVKETSEISLPPYILCLPRLDVTQYRTTATFPYDSTKESLARLIIDKAGGCDVVDDFCKGLVRSFNAVQLSGRDLFVAAYSGPVRLPVAAYKFSIPIPNPAIVERITAILDTFIAKQQGDGRLAKLQNNITYSLSVGRLHSQSQFVIGSTGGSDGPRTSRLEKMGYPPRGGLPTNLAQVFVGVWDNYVDKEHCGFGQANSDNPIKAHDPAQNLSQRTGLTIPLRSIKCGALRAPDFYNPILDHGTHVAGLLAARAVPSVVVGLNPKANIWAYEIGDGSRIAQDNDPFDRVVSQFPFGVPRVVNISMAELKQITPTPIHQFILSHRDQSLFVTAAGGSKGDGTEMKDRDNCLVIPACLSVADQTKDWVLSVVAVDSTMNPLAEEQVTGQTSFTGGKRYLTNWGKVFDVAAIGDGVSTVYGDYARDAQGTSVAVPYVSGLASLLIGKHYNKVTPRVVKKRILYTVTLTRELDLIAAWGLINFDRALKTDSDIVVVQQTECEAPPNCTFYKRLDRKQTRLVIETGLLNGQRVSNKPIDGEKLRRIARMPGDDAVFWVIIENDTGLLEKYVDVRFTATPKLYFLDGQPPKEKSLVTIEDFTSAMELK